MQERDRDRRRGRRRQRRRRRCAGACARRRPRWTTGCRAWTASRRPRGARGLPRDRRRRLTASASPREIEALWAAGAVACLRKDQELDEIVEAIRSARRRLALDGAMRLTRENTAVVLDSTADFPEAPERFPNLRVVPLYVRFGDESFRDYVELGPTEFYARLRTAPELPTTSQPTPQDFLQAYEELAGYERIYSLHISSKLSGTFASASLAAGEAGTRPRQARRHRVGLRRDCDARPRGPAAARAWHDRRGDRRRRRAAPDATRGSCSRSTRSSSSPRAAASGGRGPLPGSLLNVKPILTIEDGEVLPLTRVRGRQKALEEFRKRFEAATTRRTRALRGHRARRGAGDRRGDPRDGANRPALRPGSSSCRRSAPSSAPTPGPARSASSGSRTALDPTSSPEEDGRGS